MKKPFGKNYVNDMIIIAKEMLDAERWEGVLDENDMSKYKGDNHKIDEAR